MISLIDKTAQVETERSLRSEMLRDSLTGLPNRFAFNERVEEMMAEPAFADHSYAVLAVDMTRFSRVNECMGAIAGDELLITFARRLVSALRPSDMLARISGDEFGVLLRLDRGLADAMRAAERIKAVLTLPFRLSELEIRVDCAIGCAILSKSVSSADEVLRNAQFALKNAKQTGTTQIYEPAQAQAVAPPLLDRDRAARRHRGRSARAGLSAPDRTELAARVSGFEALARWQLDGQAIAAERVHPGRRGIRPDRPARPLGARHRHPDARRLGPENRHPPADQRQRQPLARPDQPRRCRRRRLRRAQRQRHRRRPPDPGADRRRDHPGSGARRPGAQVPAALRREDRDGRFRLGLYVAGLAAIAADRHPQDRPALRLRHAGRRRQRRDRRRHPHRSPRALGMETTAEGIESAALAAALLEKGCTFGQGFLYSEALPGRRGAGLLAGTQRLIDVAPGHRPRPPPCPQGSRPHPFLLDRLDRPCDHRPGLRPISISSPPLTGSRGLCQLSSAFRPAPGSPCSRMRSIASAAPIR